MDKNIKKINNIKEEKKYIIIRRIITIIFLSIFTIAGIKAFPVVMSMSTESGRIAFKQNVEAMGNNGPLYVLAIQVLQMIVAVIPGEPVEMAASMCFGFKKGIILCLVGFFIGSCIIFIIVRNVGMGFIQLFFSKEKIESIKDKKYFKNTAAFEAALFIIFIIPGIPKDIFLYMAGLTPIKMTKFLFLATFARTPALIISNFAGQRISQGKLHEAILLYVATLVIGLTAVYITNLRERAKKRKSIES